VSLLSFDHSLVSLCVDPECGAKDAAAWQRGAAYFLIARFTTGRDCSRGFPHILVFDFNVPLFIMIIFDFEVETMAVLGLWDKMLILYENL